MGTQDAIAIFTTGVDTVKPAMLIPQYLQVTDKAVVAGGKEFLLTQMEGIYLLSVGKAASAMAGEMEKILGASLKAGLVVTKYGHALPLHYCTTIEAGHPVPDKNSVIAANTIIDFLQQLQPASLLLCCISGGASALLADIADGIALEDMRQLSTLLLQCGADIHEINTVRKQLSTLKGGRLVSYANGATIATCIISDVLGDDMSVIASGLTIGNASTFAGAWNVLEKYGLTEKIPADIHIFLQKGIQGTIAETPNPGDIVFNKVHNHIIGSNNMALEAAAKKATQLGYATHIINSNLHGDVADAAHSFVKQLVTYAGTKPACLLMGGETTVTLQGNGKGGRNQHFVLAALCDLIRLQITPGDMSVILSGGTDGTDGPTDAAGAFIDGNVINTMHQQGLHPLAYLQNNDAYHFFKQLNALLITGPTQTNVMDIIVGLV